MSRERSAMSVGRRLFVSLGIGVVLMLGVSQLRSLHAQTTDAAPAAAPAPAPVKGPDPTGAATGTAADVAVKDAANPTLAEVMETVGHNKISINFVWMLHHRLPGHVHADRVRDGRDRLHPREERRPHHLDELHGLPHRDVRATGSAASRCRWAASAPLAALGGVAPLNHEVGITLFGKTFELFGARGFFLGGDVYDVGVFALFLFQMVFMDTAVTIPTGAMAERWKWSSFLVYGLLHVDARLPPLRQLGVGRRLARRPRRELRPRPRPRGLRRLLGRAHGGRRRRARRRDRARAAPRQVRQERQADRDTRPPHPDGDRRHVHPGLRLVRLQPGLDARRDRPAHRRRRHQHDARRHRRRASPRCSS